MFVYNLFPVHWDRGAAASQQSNDCRDASSKTFPNEEESQRFQQSFKHCLGQKATGACKRNFESYLHGLKMVVMQTRMTNR